MAFDFSRYEAIFLDLDGTICQEDHPLPGAVELLRRLQQERIKFACLTNSTTSPAFVAARLGRMGVTVDEQHVYSAGAGAADYVMEKFGQGARVFNLATQGVRDLLNGKVEWVETVDKKCDVVIAGVPAEAFAGEDRQRTAIALLRNGAALVGCCADRVYPSPRGLEVGSGAFTLMLAYAADVKPVFTGKPEKLFFKELCERLKVRSPENCLLIGDNLESDGAGAQAVGMEFVLTLSGITRREHLQAMPEAMRPRHVIEDLRELL